MSDLDTGENTPVSRPRTKEQQRWDGLTRFVSKTWPAFSALVLALASMFIKTWSDNREADRKAAAIVQTTEKTTAEVKTELGKLKAQDGVLATTIKDTSKLAVETHEDAPRPRKRRAKPAPELAEKVQSNIGVLTKVEDKAKEPVKVATPDAGSGG